MASGQARASASSSKLAAASVSLSSSSAPASSGSSSASAQSAEASAASAGSLDALASKQAADDFFARAQAMGLRLTRADFERTRAGVAAFLKAERVAPSAEAATSSAAAPPASSPPNVESAPAPARLAPRSSGGGSNASAADSATAGAGGSGASPALSFFTAVVPSPALTETASERARPSLDEISSQSERRMRKEKRRRQKARLAAAAAAAVTPGGTSTAPAATSTPLGNVTPSMRATSGAPPGSAESGAASSSGASSAPRFGLGLDVPLGTPSPAPSGSTTLHRAYSAPPQESPHSTMSSSIGAHHALSHLSRRACVSPGGTLSLLDVPVQLSPGTPQDVDADDSGVWLDPPVTLSAPASTMLPSDPWAEEPPLRCRTTSGASSERALQEGLTRMSFLDRIMAAKGSPARRRREAKERERREREGQMDISPLRARAHSQEPARSQRLDEQLETEADVQEEEDGEEEDAVGSLGGGLKSVRWADANTNHRRMTTREHYDLLFHGITPGLEDAAAGSSSTEPANGASAAAPWEETSNMLAWAVSQQQQEQGAGSSLQLLRSGHAANGSPLAQRMHSLAHLPASPDILALDLQGTEACGVRLTPGGFPARRGLLFGPSASPGGYMLSSAGALAAAFAQEGASPGELSAPFPQGPTLARSPARGFPPIGSSSSPARGLRGAASLAAPFGIRESPDRAGLAARGRVASSALQRASGSAAGERRRGPVGWASHSPMRRYDTISPAALFGAPLVPEPDAADESGPSASKAPPAPPAPLPEPTKRRAHKNAATPRVGESDLDGEGDDEWASPEVSIKVSRASSSIRGMPPTSPFDASSQAAVGMDAADRLAGFAATARQERGRNNSYPNDESSPEFGTQRDADAPPRRFVMPASSSSLATALGVPSEERRVRLGSAQPAQRREKSAGASKGKGSKSGGEGEAEASASASGGDGAAPAPRPPGAKKPRNDKKRAAVTPAQAQVGKSEWDRPDGSRIVRLVSEELQAALDAGDVEAPPSRYYKLPPGFGASTGKPSSVSYAGLIGQAILSSSDGKLSLNEVYNWISAVHPFYERGDRGWQNSIRHNLSLNKSFLKVEREANMPGKGGFWAIKPGHEDRFRAGVYIAAPEGKASTPDVAPKSKEPPAKAAAASTASATKPAKELGPDDPEWEAMMPWSKRDPNVPFDAPPGRARNGGGTKERRKRIASNNSAQSEQRSDAEARAPEAAAAAPGSAPGAKRTKAATASGSGSSKKVKLAKARGSPLRPVQTRQSPGPDAANAAEPAAFAESLDMTTPSRPGFSVYASSGHGSTHTNAVPMLTDSASSPPSSPMLEMQAFGNRARAAGAGMLPPSGGASSQSARKRKAARNRGHAQQIPSAAPSLFAPDPMAGHSANGAGNMAGGVPFLGGGMQVSSYNDVGTTFLGNGGYLGSGFTYSHHSLQGSPLAGMQGRLRPGVHGAGMGASFGGSPLRRQNVPPPVPGAGSGASPSRLLSMHSPVSSLRGAGPRAAAASQPSERSTANKDTVMQGRSPRRASLSAGSPMRGSPLRPGGALGTHGGREVRAVASPAGMHLQMAVDGPAGAGMSSLGMGLQPTGGATLAAHTPSRPMSNTGGSSTLLGAHFAGTPGSTGLQRWSSAAQASGLGSGISPGLRRFTPSRGGAATTSWLDDPFDYGGALQHELDLAAQMGGLDGSTGMDISPMRIYGWSQTGHSHLHPQQPLPQQHGQQHGLGSSYGAAS
jgi:hypothetical protein